VATKTLAATAMAGAQTTINNQQSTESGGSNGARNGDNYNN
jgi:hypothetical protein